MRSTPYDGVTPYKIKEMMHRSGYTAVATTLAMAGLKQKEMLQFEEREGDFNQTYTVCSLTPAGLDWMLKNQDRFRLVVERKTTSADEPIRDEDIPF
jgi:hypothetical protein